MEAKIITDVSGVFKVIEKHKKEVAFRNEFAMKRAGLIVKRLADFYCPKDTLALVLSGEIIVEGSGFNSKMRVTYGGPDAPYALWVHEDQDKAHAPPTQAKWLERAIRETRGAVTNMVKRVMSAGIRLSKDGFEVE